MLLIRESLRSVFIIALSCIIAGCSSSAQKQFCFTGDTTSDQFNPCDQAIEKMMVDHKISSAALAITYKGKLLHARGFSYDIPSAPAVTPYSRFRIASISKPITSVAIYQLIEQGKLKLDEKMVDIIDFTPPPGEQRDPRVKDITVRHLLEHLGGWDRDKAFDPMFMQKRITRELDVKGAYSTANVITFMAGQPLQHDPGTVMSYSNFGYCLLGRIVEKRTGMNYDDYVKQHVLAPLGINNMTIGRTNKEQLYADEVTYLKSSHESPYQYSIEIMDSHGGWISSAVDLIRFANAFDDPQHCPILSAESIRTMFSLPENKSTEEYKKGDYYYGSGWMIRDYGNGRMSTWHNGSLPGTYTMMVRFENGVDIVVLFNKRYSGISEIDPIMGKLIYAMADWPEKELDFDKLNSHPSCTACATDNEEAAMDENTLQVAMCQIFCLDGDREGNFVRIENALTQAAAKKADIACFPETSLLGWINPDAHDRACPIPGDDSKRLCQLAKKHQLYICIGLAEKQGDNLYDSALLIDNTGKILLKHRKINVLTNLMTPPYTAGDSVAVADTQWGKIGVLICADSFHEPTLDKMKKMQPDLLLVPYGWAQQEDAWPGHGKALANTVSHAARQIGCPLIGTDLVGSISHGPWTGMVYGGQSVASDATGTILGTAADRDAEVKMLSVKLNEK